MKRVISLLLCLIMCVSVFSATTAPVFALGNTDEIFTVEKTELKNNRITYTISLAPDQSELIGTVIKAEFDSTVLEVASDSGAVCSVNSYGEYTPVVPGYYECGLTYDNADVYSVAYMNPNGVNTGEDGKAFVKFAFELIGEKRPITEVKFYCEEYITEDGKDEDADGIDDNDIKKSDPRQLIYEDSFFTLVAAENVEVASCVEGLKFTWTEVVGAEKYNIYRKEADGEWSKLVDVPAGTSEYIDATIEKGKEYYYSVEVENEYGKREYDKTGLVGFNFGTITEVDAELTERGAKVTWGALDYAVNYSVYRQAEGETTWKKVGETNELSWIDEPLMSNIEYSYKVKAHHEKGYTADTSVDPAKVTFIANATIIEYELNFNDIVINWQGVDGAVGYEIYRKSTGENDYTLIATVDKPGFTDDNDIVVGNEYSYKVRSLINLETKDGSVLGEDSFDLVKLPVVTDISATLGGDNVSVSWEAVDLAEEYVILRQDNNNGNWFEIATVNASQTKYSDRAVNSGKTYTYAIRTKADGMITKEFATSNSVYYLTAPTVKGVKNGSKGIEFSFNKVVGASAYNIYRKDVNASDFGAPIGTVSATSELVFVDSTAVSGGIYVYGVQSVYGDVLSGISTSSVICCLEEPKLKIESIYDGVKLTWNAVPSAEKYVVYYGMSRELSEMIVLGETTDTDFVYNKCISGRNNYFAVEAVCGETISTKTQKYIYYFAAPVVELIDNMSNGIKIRWNIVNGADSYILYRKAGSATTWTKVKTVSEDEEYPYVQYTDKNVKSGTKYTYTVKAYDGDEYSPYNEKGWSKEFLTTPKIKSIDNYYGGPKISWGKVTGAKKYEVYRRTKSSDWKEIGTTSSTSYVDSTAKSGTKYYYAIRAVDGSSKSYNSTSHFNDVCKTVTYSPVLKLANTTSTDIKVSWNKVSGAKKYVVYRKAGSAKSWKKIKTTTSTSYTDESVKNGTTYKYMVKALNSKSKTISSSKSSGTTIRCISAPKLSSVKSAKSGITFKWNKVSGASGYYVYRKTGSGDYEKIATVKGGTKISYLDKKAKKGKTYYYTVKAYYSSYSSAYRSGLKIKDKY